MQGMRLSQLLARCSLLWLLCCLVTTTGTPAVSRLYADELPDPLQFISGKTVASPQQWQQRRIELQELFQKHVYGYMPPAPAFRKRLAIREQTLESGMGRLIEIDEQIGPEPGKTITLHLLLILPAKTSGPVPVFLAFNKCGNHEVLADQVITKHDIPWVHSGCVSLERGGQTDYWCVSRLLERGYGFATMHVDDIDPDKDDSTDGVHSLYENWFEQQQIPLDERWGTISAWAWGLHRGVDLLETVAAVDPKKIAVIGHSRRGKTALFAAAMDERIALVVPHQSGTGGMALNRNNDQETVRRITTVFPHWFCGRYATYADREQEMPIDQHELIALVAPRPLLETSGLQDTWANYVSSYQAIQAAAGVYRFLGVSGLKQAKPFTTGMAITAENTGELLQYRLDTKHILNVDYWNVILDFADLHFGQ